MLKNFRTYQFSVDFFHACEQVVVPTYLRDQLLRASSSVVLNIAEGSGKPTPADQRRFYGIALGSLRECQAILEITKQGEVNLRQLADKLGAHLYVLAKKKSVA